MAAKFKKPESTGPQLIGSEPQKAQSIEQVIQPGLEHRPFKDDEIKQAFDTFDLDGNRFVGAQELRHILDIIGEDATDEEIDEMIRMCDNDGDGQVTFDEFHRMMTTPEPPKPPAVPPRVAQKKRGAAARRHARYLNQDVNKVPQKKQNEAARAQASSMRAVSVESLVKKLSGGMDKIKPSQIKRIYKRFQDIDLDKSGAVDYEEFVNALDLEDSTIARQMFKVFDMDDSNSIELKEFIVVLSRYTTASKTEKLKFAFMMFDEDGSGYIERGELLEMLSASFAVEGYSYDELEEKADQVFETLGLPPDGAIGYEDFLKLARVNRSLIYPIEQEKHALGGNVSIDALFQDEDE
eukprot:TRINITY_DN105584_c0_g1_i1.p1 TRINITY_DN105584_c0_g1~~TRINITY_DN105584_c0_g1_i1.p1  ORF type:complete len:352 (+),score=109.62 TRINITY_DN105584_c0_g1_i1:94-1149(+)